MGKHHVVPHGDGWAVKAEGSSRASAVFAKQEEAIAAAKKIAANQGGVVLIHRPDGTIRSERVERIMGTITVDVESGESLEEVRRKIEKADKRLKALAAAVAAKRKASERRAAKKPVAKKAPAKRATATEKAAAKKPAPKRPAAFKSVAKKSAVPKPSSRKPSAKKAPAKRKTARKAKGEAGFMSILSDASKAIRKLAAKR